MMTSAFVGSMGNASGKQPRRSPETADGQEDDRCHASESLQLGERVGPLGLHFSSDREAEEAKDG